MRAVVAKKGEQVFFHVNIQKMTGTIIDPNGDGQQRIKDNRYMVFDVSHVPIVGYIVLQDKEDFKSKFDAHPTDQVDMSVLPFFG